MRGGQEQRNEKQCGKVGRLTDEKNRDNEAKRERERTFASKQGKSNGKIKEQELKG